LELVACGVSRRTRRVAIGSSAEGVALALSLSGTDLMRNRLRLILLSAGMMFVSGEAMAACPAPPPPVVNIPGVAYYTDAKHSVRDEALFQANREQLEPLDQYLANLARMSDAYLRGEREAGQCTLTWLAAWAKEGALLGEPTAGPQARSQRRWSAAAMAIAALKVWDVNPNPERTALQAYFRRLAQAVQSDTKVDNVRNNLLYWAGLVGIASARLTGDAAMRDWAVGVCRSAITTLTPQGSLPLEDLRGDRAVDYNGFALFPLSVIATLNGGHTPGCAPADLQPLAHYVLDQRARTSDKFLRWAPFMGTDVAIKPEAMFYAYGGGHLPSVAVKLAALSRQPLP
jgi:hypothetical protein